MRNTNLCIHCANKVDGQCRFSEPDLPIQGNSTDRCVFKPSRFEPKEEKYGKVISPIEQTQPYPAGAGPIRSPTPEPSGFCLACRRSPDGLGSINLLIREEKVYHPATLKYLGELSDFETPKATPEQLDQAWQELKTRFKL